MRITAISLGLVLTTSLALAHSGATGIVKERMDEMGLLAAAMKSLVTMTRAGQLETEKVRANAQVLIDHSGPRLLARFPEGSMPTVSEARETIWQDWDGFTKWADALTTRATALDTAAAEGLIAGAEADQLITAIADTCSACHETYRLKK